MDARQISDVLAAGPVCAASDAMARVPTGPGYYSIFVDSAESLPMPYRDRLTSMKTELLYIGIATASLHQRLFKQDLRHRNPSTFFRGIGAILGYRPPTGSLLRKKNQNNYKFNAADTKAIIDWINGHLLVAWIEEDPAYGATERFAIAARRPLLNTKHNPNPCAELRDLRLRCRQVALSR